MTSAQPVRYVWRGREFNSPKALHKALVRCFGRCNMYWVDGTLKLTFSDGRPLYLNRTLDRDGRVSISKDAHR